MRVLPRQFLTVATIAAAVLVTTAGPAAAGGPTSVLLVSPATGDTAALYHSDVEYVELRSALGTEMAADAGAPNLQGGPGTGAINVTWLIHDVAVWRVDRVFLDVQGGPWVETVESMNAADMGQPGVVHRPEDPELLLRLLDRLGLDGTPAETDGAEADGAGAAAGVGSAGSTGSGVDGGPVTTDDAAAASRWTGWWWAVPALVVGVVVGALAASRGPLTQLLSGIRRRSNLAGT